MQVLKADNAGRQWVLIADSRILL